MKAKPNENTEKEKSNVANCDDLASLRDIGVTYSVNNGFSECFSGAKYLPTGSVHESVNFC